MLPLTLTPNQTVDVPQSASLYRYLDQKDFAAAHRVACLGVTDEDWRQLAEEALKSLDLGTARKAFVRLKDTKFLELLGRIEAERRQPSHDDKVLIANPNPKPNPNSNPNPTPTPNLNPNP